MAEDYEAIFYIEIADSSYVGYEVNNIYGQLEDSKSGEDFYADCIEIEMYENKQKLKS